jgi:hypothetical protein
MECSGLGLCFYRLQYRDRTGLYFSEGVLPGLGSIYRL